MQETNDIDSVDILGYESPIKVFCGKMRISYENHVAQAVQDVGIDIDKDELIRALKYDRNQYDKGYIAGYNRKASEVANEFIKAVDDMINLISEMTGLDITYYGKYAELKNKYKELIDSEDT